MTLSSVPGSFRIRTAAAVLTCLWAPALTSFALGQDSPPPAASTPALQQGVQSRYSRVLDASDGRELVLQLSSRTFKPTKPGQPIVRLVGVVHIGDDAYYQALQKHLDTNDLVLFEGVKPAGTHGSLENADDAAKSKVTGARQRLLAVLLERHHKKHGAYPATLEELTGALLGASARLASAATVDAWGHPLQYVTVGAPAASFDLVSLGADGVEGGEKANADLKFSAQKPLTKKEKSSSGEGIQVQLAEALGLK
ncbi:MAG: type II secretion system protein GspG, partial [Planctomycetota bacterium]|nr:type II secretion system protein GspG [Planctomycetota bacterium]